MTYSEFIESKIPVSTKSGFVVSDSDINPILKPHQRDAVKWAIEGGKRAVFASFGLGKTLIGLEFCRITTEREGGQALIVLPLGVRQEFTRDAKSLLGISPPVYVRNMAEVNANSTIQILMTNYERVRDGDIELTHFTAVVLDEASALRYGGSKTNQMLMPKIKGVKYRLVATATPSPNRFKELVHYAGFLEIMDVGQILNRFFKRDSTKARQPTLLPGKEEEFWLWLGTWALFITTPSDMGYSDDGYDLPELDIRTHKINVDNGLFERKDGTLTLFREASSSLQHAAREKGETIDIRIAKAKEIVDSDPAAHFILWHDREAERAALKKAMPETVEVYGSLDYEEREQRIIDFSNGKFRLLATKKSISGQGCNFQKYCHRAIFVGIDYEFHDFLQAIHRIHRFLQDKTCIIDIIYTENEAEILKALFDKWENHNILQQKMRGIVKKYGLSGAKQIEKLKRKIGVERVQIKGQNFTAINNDCVVELEKTPDNLFDMICTSIPFGNLFEYSESYSDMGHNDNLDAFFRQMDYLSPHLLRTLKPGRVYACHVKDRTLYGNVTGLGMTTIEPFHAFTIMHYAKHGFQFFGMITVVTDVVRENNQTYRLGWTEQCKDGSKMGVGCPEYILLFRKLPTDKINAYADKPITKTKEGYTRAQWQLDAHSYWRSGGDRLITKDELLRMDVGKLQAAYLKYSRNSVYDYHKHVELAKSLDEKGRLPSTFMVVAPGSWDDTVWDDIVRMRTLNTTQARRKEVMHICPLPLDIVERLINRFSNESELICDPFAGLFTVPVQAVKMKRKGFGIELNADYFRDGLGYLKEADEARDVFTLFDLISD